MYKSKDLKSSNKAEMLESFGAFAAKFVEAYASLYKGKTIECLIVQFETLAYVM